MRMPEWVIIEYDGDSTNITVYDDQNEAMEYYHACQEDLEGNRRYILAKVIDYTSHTSRWNEI